MKKNIKVDKWLLAIIVIALVLRLIAISFAPPIMFDGVDYNNLAQSIANGNGFKLNYSTIYGPHITSVNPAGSPYLGIRAPGYPLFVGLIYSIFGYHQIPVYIIQILLDMTIVIMLFLLAKRLFQKSQYANQYAYISALVWAINPIIIYYNVSILTETLSLFLFFLGLFLFIDKVFYDKKYIYFLLVSLVFGYLYLIKPFIMPLYVFLLMVFGCMLYKDLNADRSLNKREAAKSKIEIKIDARKKKSYISLWVFGLLIFTLLSSSYMIRNYYLFGKPVGSEMSYSLALIGGSYNLFTDTEMKQMYVITGDEYRNMTTSDAINHSNQIISMFKERVKEKPGLYMSDCIKRATLLWIEPFGVRSIFLFGPHPTITKTYSPSLNFVLEYGFFGFFKDLTAIQFLLVLVIFLIWLGFLATALYGLYLVYFRYGLKLLVLGILFCCALFTGVYTLTIVAPRYFLQIFLILIIPFSVGLSHLFLQVKDRFVNGSKK
jgi:4-amino-4-deoxy-L-arabinose transferase-like glycosyltransferase